MSGKKVQCPACGRGLHISAEPPPPKLRCPVCKTRLRMDGAGNLHLREGAVAEEGQPTLELHPVPDQAAAVSEPAPVASSGRFSGNRKLVWGASLGVGTVVLGVAVLALSGAFSGKTDKVPAGPAVVDLGARSTPEGTAPGGTSTLPPAPPALPAEVMKEAPPVGRPAAGSGKKTPIAALAAKPRPTGSGIVAASFEVPAGMDRPAFEQAIARGVRFLKAEARQETLLGAKALAGLTLLHCGVPPGDPEVRRLAEEVRGNAPRLTKTYEISCCIWFLDRLGEKTDQDAIRSLALNLIAAQGAHGGWGYDCKALAPAERQDLLRRLRQPLQGGNTQVAGGPKNQGNPFPKGQGKSGKINGKKGPAKKGPGPNLADLPVLKHRYGEPLSSRPPSGYEDNSATQFVVLALWSAQKHGVPAGRSLAMVESRFRESQAEDGGWIYEWDGVSARLGISAQGPNADSMTCAGLLGLAVGRGAWLELRSGLSQRPPSWSEKETDQAIEKALRFLERRITTMRPVSRTGLQEIEEELDRVTKRARTRGLKVKELDRLLVREKELREQHTVLRNQVRSNSLSARNGAVVGSNAGGDLYFLWSLARMAVVYDLKTIGQVDWYAWGAPRILAAQNKDGSWSSGYPGVPDTCFALLFLRRANVARDLTTVLQDVTFAKNAGQRGQGQSGQGQGTTISQVKGLQ